MDPGPGIAFLVTGKFHGCRNVVPIISDTEINTKKAGFDGFLASILEVSQLIAEVVSVRYFRKRTCCGYGLRNKTFRKVEFE